MSGGAYFHKVWNKIPACDPNVAAIKHRACALTLATKELHQRTLSPWRHRMVPHNSGSHQLCAKLRNHHCEGWERVADLFFSTLLVSHGVLSPLGTCPTAAISDSVSFSKLVKDSQVD